MGTMLGGMLYRWAASGRIKFLYKNLVKPHNECIWDIPLKKMEKAMATHSSPLALEVLSTEEPGRLQSMGSQRLGHDWATSLSLFTFMHWRGKWQPTPVFLPGGSQGWESGGLPSMGSHRVGHDWSDLAAADMKASSTYLEWNYIFSIFGQIVKHLNLLNSKSGRNM